MLPLSQIQALRATVTDDWCSAAADAVAERWAVPPGAARWWRSSASHVFVVPDGGTGEGARYLRFVPAHLPAAARLVAGAQVHTRLHDDGAPVARLVRSASGEVVERVRTGVGDVVAYAVRQAQGVEREVDDLDADAARTWGAALGELHRHGGDPGPGDPVAELVEAFAPHVRTDDPELASAARTLSAAGAELPPGPRVVGHGDLELDNLRWDGDRITCFDLDEAAAVPAAADVASAVRDLVGTDPAAPEHPRLLDAFLDGYRRSTGTDVDRRSLQVHGAALAAGRLSAAPDVLDVAGGPAWLADLRTHLEDHYARQRALVVATARAIEA